MKSAGILREPSDGSSVSRAVEACPQGSHAVIRTGICRQSYGRHGTDDRIAVPPHLRDQVEAVQAGHSQIGYQNRWWAGIELAESLLS